MARKPIQAAEAAQDDAPAFVAITILAEGVKIDGAGHLPVGISILAPRAQAEALKAEGKAE